MIIILLFISNIHYIFVSVRGIIQRGSATFVVKRGRTSCDVENKKLEHEGIIKRGSATFVVKKGRTSCDVVNENLEHEDHTVRKKILFLQKN